MKMLSKEILTLIAVLIIYFIVNFLTFMIAGTVRNPEIIPVLSILLLLFIYPFGATLSIWIILHKKTNKGNDKSSWSIFKWIFTSSLMSLFFIGCSEAFFLFLMNIFR